MKHLVLFLVVVFASVVALQFNAVHKSTDKAEVFQPASTIVKPVVPAPVEPVKPLPKPEVKEVAPEPKPVPEPTKVEPPKEVVKPVQQIEPPKQVIIEPTVNEAWKDVFRKAQVDKKKVIVDFGMNNCHWCTVMDQQVIPFTNFNNYSMIKTLDTNLAAQYGLRFFPSFIIFDGTGKELKRATGYMDKTAFQSFLDN